MNNIVTSLRLVALTLLVCCIVYPSVILAFAQLAVPDSAAGSLIKDDQGHVLGSRLIAQGFTSPHYFWPRPSAADYNAGAAAGSNLSPTSPKLTERAAMLAARYGATPGHPLPADLATASGSGLDPHITEAAAYYQAPRVAAARGISPAAVEALIRERSFIVGGQFAPDRIVNVLTLNLALDRLH